MKKHHAVAPPSFRAVLREPGVAGTAVRYVLGPLIAGGLATALGIGHPYWAAVAATVPLVGATLGAQLGRGLHRLAGTAIGILAAGAVIAPEPPLWVLVAAVIVFQLWAELWALRHYGIATIGITPLALVMSHLASPVPVGQLMTDRLLETALGVTVAVALLLLPRRRISGS